uniref:Uncharacterized protein n=1 Tax=Paramormyrops kingsleyae TaxID=1676925 RepID=A0A3B3RYA0_9TELE
MRFNSQLYKFSCRCLACLNHVSVAKPSTSKRAHSQCNNSNSITALIFTGFVLCLNPNDVYLRLRSLIRRRAWRLSMVLWTVIRKGKAEGSSTLVLSF